MRHTASIIDMGRRYDADTQCEAGRLGHVEAGAQGPTAMAEFAARPDQRRLAAVRAFRSPTTDVAHGRIETRTCALLNLDTTPDEFADLPGRRQAFRITRERSVQRTGKHAVETTWGLTSLTPARAGPAEVPALNRGHWEIENRLHYVR